MDSYRKIFQPIGETILITGGAQGIGRAIAEYFAEIGINVAIFDNQGDKGLETAKYLTEKFGVKSLAYQVDVTDYEKIEQTLQQAVTDFGKIEMLFNNAGIVIHKPANEITKNEWFKVIDVNLNGVFYVAQAFGKYLIQNNIKGAIVNTASMSGTIVNFPQLQASYNTAKAGVIHLTKSLAVEWAEHGIRVNSVSPGYIYTELTSFVRQDWQDSWIENTPVKRFGKTEELIGAVVYLFSKNATFAVGTDIIVDGGYTIL